MRRGIHVLVWGLVLSWSNLACLVGDEEVKATHFWCGDSEAACPGGFECGGQGYCVRTGEPAEGEGEGEGEGGDEGEGEGEAGLCASVCQPVVDACGREAGAAAVCLDWCWLDDGDAEEAETLRGCLAALDLASCRARDVFGCVAPSCADYCGDLLSHCPAGVAADCAEACPGYDEAGRLLELLVCLEAGVRNEAGCPAGLVRSCREQLDGGEGEGGLDGSPLSRTLALSDDPDPELAETSRWERQKEPLEVPLVAGGYLDDSVVGYWPLDGELRDVSGHMQASRRLGDPEPIPGRIGGGVAFDGDDAYDAGDHEAWDGMASLSVCAWIQPTRLGGTAPVVNKILAGDEAPDARAWSLLLFRQQGPELSVWTDDGQGTAHGGDGLVAVGEWAHLCGTWDGGHVRIYVDGRQQGAAPLGGRMPATAASLRIGNCQGPACGDSHFSGTIDDVVILNRALSPLEIKHYYEYRQPWGTPLLPGAQPDYDDLTVTEDGGESEHEVVGALPLADRPEDLDEHVVAYLPLDGDWTDLKRGAAGTVSVAVGRPTLGRFGDAGGALRFQPGQSLSAPRVEEIGTSDQFTVELWVLVDEHVPGNAELVRQGGHPMQICFDIKAATHEPRIAVGPSDVWDGVTAPDPLPVGTWHHLATTHDGHTLRLFVDGVEVGKTEARFAQTEDELGLLTQDGLNGRLDELVFHDAARSADYIYKRAHPLPWVRFLVGTEDTAADGRYPYRTYRLHWGNPDATRPASRWTTALLSPDNGYVAWWRFNEDTGGVAIDSSVNRLLGTLEGAPTWTSGAEGAALRLDGEDDRVVVADAPALDLGSDDFTIELAGRADLADIDDEEILEKGTQPGATAGYQVFAKEVRGGEYHWQLCPAGAPTYSQSSPSGVFDGQWHTTALIRSRELGMLGAPGCRRAGRSAGATGASSRAACRRPRPATARPATATSGLSPCFRSTAGTCGWHTTSGSRTTRSASGPRRCTSSRTSPWATTDRIGTASGSSTAARTTRSRPGASTSTGPTGSASGSARPSSSRSRTTWSTCATAPTGWSTASRARPMARSSPRTSGPSSTALRRTT